MFIVMNYSVTGWEQWREGHDTVGNEEEETTLFTRKVFGSYEAAAKYIEDYFAGRSENYTIRWNDRDSLINCIVDETRSSWEDEDEGGRTYVINRLSIQELENELS